MKKYYCDYCEKYISEDNPPVKLEGISGTSGGILLPERLYHKDFCSTDCFWRWALDYMPEKIKEVIT